MCVQNLSIMKNLHINLDFERREESIGFTIVMLFIFSVIIYLKTKTAPL